MSGANSMLESSQNRRKTAVGRNPMIRPDEAVSRAQETRMKGTELTGKQQLALTLIRRSLKERGVPPTRAELASEMGLAHPTSVDKHLIALERKGWADISRATSRGIRLLREGAPLLEEGDIPTIRAGTPILAEERRKPKRLNDFESFSEHFDGTPDYFLRVRGRLARQGRASQRRSGGGATHSARARRRPRRRADRTGRHAEALPPQEQRRRRASAREHKPGAPEHPDRRAHRRRGDCRRRRRRHRGDSATHPAPPRGRPGMGTRHGNVTLKEYNDAFDASAPQGLALSGTLKMAA